MPLAITTGSPRFISADTHVGEGSYLPLPSRSLNPPTPPAITGPCVTSNLNFECTGPQNGARIHRVPTESSHVDSAPQLPASWKSTSSLQNRSERYNG